MENGRVFLIVTKNHERRLMKMGLERLREYQQFENINDLRATIDIYLNNPALNTNTRRVLEYITACATRYTGACTLLRQTIADKLHISKATVARALMTLRQENMIETHPTRKKSQRGGSGANIIQILPCETPVETPHDTPLQSFEDAKTIDIGHMQGDRAASVNYLSLSNNYLDTLQDTPISVQQEQTLLKNLAAVNQESGLSPDNLNVIGLFSTSVSEAEKMIQIILRAKACVSQELDCSILLEDTQKSIHITLLKIYKNLKTKAIKNQDNYAFITFMNLFKTIHEEAVTATRYKNLNQMTAWLNQ